MIRDYTSNLTTARELITSLLTSIRTLDPSLLASVRTSDPTHLTFHAPVIDRLNPAQWVSDNVTGLKKFAESIMHHSSQLHAMAASGVPLKEDPLPNVAGLVTIWKQLLLATRPIAAIRTILKGKGKEEGFVDVIARGGEEWIRIYSKKVSHLLSEFREQDSYINSDCDSDSSAGSSTRPIQNALTNSIITTARSLLSIASHAERIPDAPIPRVTMRLSRIEEHPAGGYEDERMAATFEEVRQMGVTLLFGDLAEHDLVDLPLPMPERRPRPSRKINLDPTSLMGLCSDILHHPLPPDDDGARRRFYRPGSALSNGIGCAGRYSGNGDGEGAGQSQNSRELVKNLLEEMEWPVIEEMRDVLSGYDGVEFWATKEAVRHATEALGSKDIVGDGMEQRRMRRLVGLEDGDFFLGSRYEGKQGVLDRLRVKVFDDDPPEGRQPICEGGCSFQLAISRISSRFLDEYFANPNSPDLPSMLQARRLPTPKVAHFSLPIAVVSLIGLRRGAEEGMTTLMMGNVVLRELWSQPRWRVKGWCHGNYEFGGDRAAVWMLPYRPLGEGKRVKFERGDYSYPTR